MVSRLHLVVPSCDVFIIFLGHSLVAQGSGLVTHLLMPSNSVSAGVSSVAGSEGVIDKSVCSDSPSQVTGIIPGSSFTPAVLVVGCS